MHVGLIGGIGPAATDYYYREIINHCADVGAALELTTVHADSRTLLANQMAGDEEAQVAIYSRLTDRLKAAGATSVSVTSIAGHFCIEAFKQVSPLPVVDMIVEVNRELSMAGCRRVGVLGTRIAMETGLYGGITEAETVAPFGSDLNNVHEAYVAMATSGRVTEAQKTLFLEASRRMIDEAGAEAIMLGGTDLVLAFSGLEPGFRVLDCARIHIDVIARMAASGAD